MVRVLIVNFKFLPYAGGVETFTLSLAQGFVERGACTKVVAINGAPLHFDSQFPFQVVRAPSLWKLRGLIARSDVVVWNAPMIKWVWLHLTCRTPRISVVHDWPNETSPARLISRLRKRALQMVTRLIRRSSDALVCVSRDVSQQFTSPTTVISNGYRADVFDIAVPPEARDAASLISTSRLVPEKGLDVLIRAVSGLRKAGLHANLCIVGDGVAKERLKDLAEREGIADQVSFVGGVDQTRLNELLNQAAIAVIPSCVREAFGLAALEAEAAGCAVVASEIGGLPEALAGTGVLVPPGDVAALTDALAELIRDPEKLRAVRRGVSAKLLHMTADAMVDRYWQVIGRVV